MNWINRLFSDVNGVPDDARVAAFLFIIGYLALYFISVFYQHIPFSPMEFAGSSAALATSMGAWLRIRGDN